MKRFLIVNQPRQWSLRIPDAEVVSAREYLLNDTFSKLTDARVYNLCKSYRYQSEGYYVSLLAQARGHKPTPDILAIQDIKSPTIIRIVSDELNDVIARSLRTIQSDTFTLSIYFGKNLARRHNPLAIRLFDQFRAPLLRAEFVRKETEWALKNIQPIAFSDVPPEHRDFVSDAAREFFRRRRPKLIKKEYRFDLAILVNPDEPFPPSDKRSLQKFSDAAESLGFYTEAITRNDASRINEFDALFIRETTGVNHHTYRIARRADAEGLIVIDDPQSILLCSNKVYLAELMQKHQIPVPRTEIINHTNVKSIARSMEYPCVIKQPDSSFSRGVVKTDTPDQFLSVAEQLLSCSDLLIAQEFLPTPFDWRIGVFNGKILFACRYYMAPKHWQIYKRTDAGKTSSGDTDTVNPAAVPVAIRKTALRAASLIGNGLYGVDLKEINGQAVVIEINDNPNIDDGIEDEYLKESLYLIIAQEFLRRIEQKKGVRHDNRYLQRPATSSV